VTAYFSVENDYAGVEYCDGGDAVIHAAINRLGASASMRPQVGGDTERGLDGLSAALDRVRTSASKHTAVVSGEEARQSLTQARQRLEQWLNGLLGVAGRDHQVSASCLMTQFGMEVHASILDLSLSWRVAAPDGSLMPLVVDLTPHCIQWACGKEPKRLVAQRLAEGLRIDELAPCWGCRQDRVLRLRSDEYGTGLLLCDECSFGLTAALAVKQKMSTFPYSKLQARAPVSPELGLRWDICGTWAPTPALAVAAHQALRARLLAIGIDASKAPEDLEKVLAWVHEGLDLVSSMAEELGVATPEAMAWMQKEFG
jgi:hypothetical protein